MQNKIIAQNNFWSAASIICLAKVGQEKSTKVDRGYQILTAPILPLGWSFSCSAQRWHKGGIASLGVTLEQWTSAMSDHWHALRSPPKVHGGAPMAKKSTPLFFTGGVVHHCGGAT